MQDAARTIEQTVTSQVNYIDSEVKQAGSQIQAEVESAVSPAAGIQLIPPAQPAETPAPAAESAPAAAEAAQQDHPATGEKPG